MGEAFEASAPAAASMARVPRDGGP